MRKFRVLSFGFGRLVVFISIFLMIANCKRKERIPSNILPQEKMRAVVWDMMRADQYLTDFVFPFDTTVVKDSESIRYYQQVLAIHNLSKDKFNRSWNYYKEHPAFMQVLMDSIGKMNTSTPPVTVTPTTDTATTPPPPKKRLLTPDSIIRKRVKKALDAQ